MEERDFTLKLLESEQMLYQIACAFLRCEPDRQDAMQETALKAWQYRDRLREAQYFRTWITRIMVNECRMICRKSRRMHKLLPSRRTQLKFNRQKTISRRVYYLVGDCHL